MQYVEDPAQALPVGQALAPLGSGTCAFCAEAWSSSFVGLRQSTSVSRHAASRLALRLRGANFPAEEPLVMHQKIRLGVLPMDNGSHPETPAPSTGPNETSPARNHLPPRLIRLVYRIPVRWWVTIGVVVMLISLMLPFGGEDLTLANSIVGLLGLLITIGGALIHSRWPPEPGTATDRPPAPAPRSGWRYRVLVPVGLALTSAANYLSWLAWDTDKSNGGPYEAWQVIGLAVVQLVLVVSAVAATRSRWTAAVVPPALVLCFAAIALNESGNSDGLWVVGAVMLAAGSAFAVAAAAGATLGIVRLRNRKAPAR